MTALLPYQQKAIDYVNEIASLKKEEALRSISCSLARLDIGMNRYYEAMQHLRNKPHIDIHFHPERLTVNGRSVIEGLYADGIFRTQYDTGISSGSPTAFAGGERDLWEKHLFGGAYHVPEASCTARPKYGALEIACHPDGASPRFGSCYFVLRPELGTRSTFTYGGSQEEDALDKTGTLANIETVMAAIISGLEKEKGAFGIGDLTVPDFLELLMVQNDNLFCDAPIRPLGRALDSFVEVQIHGTIDLGQDVERLVADPSFRNGPIEESLKAIREKYAIPLNWHPGFVISAEQVPEEFRGYPVKPLAKRIAVGGGLDAAKIGEAANSVQLDPESWQDWGSSDYILTQFRRLWHILVLNGDPSK